MRRRLLIVLGLALVLMAVLPTVAFAAAGGGSSSFGGSGGGGGGGGGKGFIIYLAFRLIFDLIIFGHGTGLVIAIVLVVCGYLYYTGSWRKVGDFFTAQRRRGPAKRRESKIRQRRVELAAAEAADRDEAFSPARVRSSAEQLFIDIQAAWSRGDVATLRTLVAPRLMGEWERRLDDLSRHGMTNHVELTRPPKVEYVGIGRGARKSASAGGGPDRVVVRIEARIRDWVTDRNGREVNETGSPTKTVRMREYWTLERNPAAVEPTSDDNGLGAEFDLSKTSNGANGRDWVLSSIEQGAEGAHQLEERIIQTDWADDQALQDEALVEQAQSEAVPDSQIADLTNTKVAIDADARARAMDLSLADGRFAPDILEVAARRAIAAWAQAIDGATQPLLKLADPDAVEQMLYPAGPSTRMVVRGPRIERISILALDASSRPATMTVDVKITGRRYLQNRASAAIVAGSDIHSVTFTERWTFALSGDAQNPWQLSAVASPALTH